MFPSLLVASLLVFTLSQQSLDVCEFVKCFGQSVCVPVVIPCLVYPCPVGPACRVYACPGGKNPVDHSGCILLKRENFPTVLCFSLLVLGYCGVLKNEEDRPLVQNGASCGDQTCPHNHRCEFPSLNTECDDENDCPIGPRCVPIPIKKPKCGRNEELKACGSACEPTCQDVEPQCGFQCLTDVCQCKKGFFRDLSSKKCVELDKCANCSLECQDHEKCEFVDLSCDNGECKKTAICTANNSPV